MFFVKGSKKDYLKQLTYYTEKSGCNILYTRTVKVDTSLVSNSLHLSLPQFVQVIISHNNNLDEAIFNQKLYSIKRQQESWVKEI